MEGNFLSERATNDLVNLLVRRGYFHANVDPELAKEDRTSEDAREYSETDANCQLVSTKGGSFMTRDRLKQRLVEQLSESGGRLSVDDVAAFLAVDSIHIEQVSKDNKNIIRVRDDLIIELYLDRMAETTNLQLVKSDGHVVVSELASSVWEMPIDLVLSTLEKRVASGFIKARLLNLSGAKVLVTPAFEEGEKVRIRGAFQAITMPTQVRAVVIKALGVSRMKTNYSSFLLL